MIRCSCYNTPSTNVAFAALLTRSCRFQGGALGLFGYDLGRRFEKLPRHAEQDIALPEMSVGIYDWALVVDHQRQRVTLLSHGDVNARLALAERANRAAAGGFPLNLSPRQANMSREEYGEKFRQIQTLVAQRRLLPVNLAQRFQAHYQGDEWLAFCRLNRENRAPFSAFLRLQQGAILSLSPERFIRLEGDNIETRPIKGTLPRLADPQADAEQAKKLASSAKDRAENLMIVDLMRNDIGRVALPGSVRVPELFVVEPFPAVHHGQYRYGNTPGRSASLRSVTCSLPRRLDYGGAQSPRDGNY